MSSCTMDGRIPLDLGICFNQGYLRDPEVRGRRGDETRMTSDEHGAVQNTLYSWEIAVAQIMYSPGYFPEETLNFDCHIVQVMKFSTSSSVIKTVISQSFERTNIVRAIRKL